jgi:predicted nucleic acid-binding protein
MISEIVAALKARGSKAVIDDDFALDIEEGIKLRRSHGTRPPGSSARFQCADRCRRTSCQSVVLPLGDLIIGACALELDYAIGTSKARDFGRIPGLNIVHL